MLRVPRWQRIGAGAFMLGGRGWLSARRIAGAPGVAASVYAFCLSRGLVFVLLILSTQLTLPTPDPDSGIYEPDIVIHGLSTTLERLRQAVDIGDASWYMVIAIYGYEQAPFDATEQHDWAFFPLYPLALRTAASLTGEFPVTGMVLSTVFLLPALILFHRFVLGRGLDPNDADRAVFYLAMYPTAYFFSLPTTESLFLLVSVAASVAAQQRRWWMSGVFGALASATRITGILLLPSLGVAGVVWILREAQKRRAGLRLAGLLLIPLGLVAFMLLLASDTGNPLAFRDVQAAWGRSPHPREALATLLDVLARPNEVSRSWDFRLLNIGAVLLALGATVVLAIRRDWDLAVYTLGGVLLPLTSGSLQALTRYVMVLFPVFIVLALAGRRTAVDGLIRTVFTVLLGLLTALFGVHFTLALA